MFKERERWLTQLFQSVDNRDTDTFIAFLSDDILFRFGNAAPVNGKAAVSEVLRGYFGSIKGIHHDLDSSWDEETVVICHGTVTYTRHDLTTLRVPFANILGLDNLLINKYLVFVDVSLLHGSA